MKITVIVFLACCSIASLAQETTTSDTTKSTLLFRKFDMASKGITISIIRELDPLYVVDGHVITTEEFKNIDGGDIASISVLKNGAEKIYGEKGNNGVILITMKENSFTLEKN